MNGQTNVQVSALATFASVTLLWLAGFFFPDLMKTAPKMLGELFTGALIVIAGIYFKPDAGIKKLPGTSSHPLVGIIVLLLAAFSLSGCTGTTAAYKAAEGLSETAYVVGEHYYAEVREANRLAKSGQLDDSEIRAVQAVVLTTRPLVVSMLDAAHSYDVVRSSANEAELADAIGEAAIAISKLVNAIKMAGGSAHYDACIDAPSYCRALGAPA